MKGDFDSILKSTWKMKGNQSGNQNPFTEDKSTTNRFIFLRKILLHVMLNPPYPQFQLKISFWKSLEFQSDLIRILNFQVKNFESPLGTDFSPEIPFQKNSKFYTDLMQVFVVCPEELMCTLVAHICGAAEHSSR